jgi:predicted aspartyl protease
MGVTAVGAQERVDHLIVGFTEVGARVSGPSGETPVQLLVDSGAKYTVLPREIWQRIGIAPQRTMTFVLADSSHVVRAISECYIELGELRGHTPVVLGQEGDVGLLGVITLEQFGLILNPFSRTLQPARMLLAAVA